MARELTCALGLVVVAAVYYGLASGIGRSALSDEVGAAGLPIVYAVMLGAIGIAIGAKAVIQALLLRARSDATRAGPSNLGYRIRRALGVLGIGVAYMLVVPLTGYLIALMLIIAAMVVYQGERLTPRVAVIAALGAAAFWLLFDRLLGIPMPGIGGL